MRKMKDSGIEWIGEIPDGWEIGPVKRLCTMQAGKNLTAEQIASEGAYPVYGGNGIRVFFHDYNCDGHFLAVGRQGALCGNVHKVNGKAWATEHAVITTPTNYINIDFLYYLLTGMDLNQYVSSTAAQPGLAVGTLLNLKTCYPISKTEQSQISRYLDAKCSKIDALLSEARSSIEEYKKLKQSVITQAVTKGVRGDRETKDSNLPWASKVPQPWNVYAIRHIMFECKERTKDGHEEQLSVTQQFGIIKSSEASIANPSLSLDDWRIVAIGDIVFNKYKAHSGVFFVSPFSGIVTFNYSVYRCFPTCYAKYFEYQYKTHGCISEFRTRMHGVGGSISPLYTKDLMKIKVVCPPLDEQKEIADYLDTKCAEIDRLIAKKEQLVKELESYKKSLIYEVVTGKREV